MIEGRYKLARIVAALSSTTDVGFVKRQYYRQLYRSKHLRAGLFATIEDVASQAYRGLILLYHAVMECFSLELEPAACVAEGYKMLSAHSVDRQMLERVYQS